MLDGTAIHRRTGDTMRNELGSALRRRVGLLAAILLLGAATAAALAGAVEDWTFATLSDPVQSLMSVLVPLLGILLVRDLRGTSPLVPTLHAAVLVAAAVGLFGAAACATALALAPPGAARDPWAGVAVIVLGGVLVQVVAQLVGTGMALLLRSAPLAFLATFLPLALWLALSAVDVLRPARDWLTPYATVRHLLSGHMSSLTWLQWLTVLMLWGAALNTAGAVRQVQRT